MNFTILFELFNSVFLYLFAFPTHSSLDSFVGISSIAQIGKLTSFCCFFAFGLFTFCLNYTLGFVLGVLMNKIKKQQTRLPKHLWIISFFVFAPHMAGAVSFFCGLVKTNKIFTGTILSLYLIVCFLLITY